jgi:[acyl-carrier-protein] S-malonyltransferase
MSKKIVALFPGQGSQHVGMAKDLLDNFKTAKEVFEEASDAAHLDIRKLCLDGPESDLTLTENTQPCLLTASIAAFRSAQVELGFQPSIVAGHSLGEYSALVAAGAIPLGQAAAWVRERGRAMQKAVPAGQGTMAAVLGMDDDKVTELCKVATDKAKQKRSKGDVPPEYADLTVEAIVEAANFNAPGQIVIAGSIDGVAEAIAMIKSGDQFPGGKAIPLSVSAPFHCKLMADARDRMAEVFSQSSVKPNALNCGYVPNRTARITNEPGIVFELLIDQIDHPVLWKQSIAGLLADDYLNFAEFGPGKVLAGLMKRIAQPTGKTPTNFNISDAAQMKTFEGALK